MSDFVENGSTPSRVSRASATDEPVTGRPRSVSSQSDIAEPSGTLMSAMDAPIEPMHWSNAVPTKSMLSNKADWPDVPSVDFYVTGLDDDEHVMNTDDEAWTLPPLHSKQIV